MSLRRLGGELLNPVQPANHVVIVGFQDVLWFPGLNIG